MDALQEHHVPLSLLHEPTIVNWTSLITRPMAIDHELLEMERCMRSCRLDLERLIEDSDEDQDLVRMLPANLFDDDEIEESCGVDSETLINDSNDLVRMLPKYVLDYEIEESDTDLVRMLPKDLFDYETEESCSVETESCSVDSESLISDSNEDLVRMLPEYLYDYEIDETSLNDLEGMKDSKEKDELMHMFVNKEEEYKCRFAQRLLWGGLSRAWIAIFYRFKCLMKQ
ncbi:hypothetical protein QVD17_17635 [Tagetes erecta]|uniref:Uncharacterized protein n=1 Tax=Tagetes erecta TaxID=13708 RepID=A0AAD8KSL9_TARER|nr:hypothetical protein QVD17_17635 [Tagetes erecta]